MCVCVPYIDGTCMAIPKQIEQLKMLPCWGHLGPPSHQRFSSLLQATRLGRSHQQQIRGTLWQTNITMENHPF